MDKDKIIEGFKEYLKSLGFTKSTITGYFLDVQKFLKWQEENNSTKVPGFIQYLRKNEINPKTVNHHIYALKKFTDYLIQNKLTNEVKITNLDDDLLYPTLELTYIEFTKTDIDKFINEVIKTGNKRYIALVLLMAKAGLKISEALELKTENINRNNISIINEERGQQRIIKASKEVLLAIKDYLTDRKGESPYLFNSNKSEKLDRTVVNRFFKEFNVTPKQLRQFFIIQCIENDKDMTNISKNAGIKSLQWLFSRYENMYYDPKKHNPEDSPEIKKASAREIIPDTKKAKPKTILGVTVKHDDSPQAAPAIKIFEEKPKIITEVDKKVIIEDWVKFVKDFNDFLYDFKMSNRTRPRLRTHGQTIKEDLEANPEYKEAFRKVCDKLPENILKNFKPMYRQGYFYLYENEIIEIARQATRDEILILLYESLRHMGKDEPVKEAKKFLGLI